MLIDSSIPNTNGNNKVRVGCAGWSYPDWKGVFYPDSLDPNKYLKFYSHYFDFVEVNSTFYNLPADDILKNWASDTPDNFRFAVKLSENITHKKAPNMEELVIEFFHHMRFLEQKIVVYLIQFPPYFKYSEDNLSYVKYILNSAHTVKYIAMEFRDASWFSPDCLSKFNTIINNSSDIKERKRIGFCTSYFIGGTPFYYDKQQFTYVRMIGDRTLTVFNKSQRKLASLWDEMQRNVRKFTENVDITDIFIIFNNHFEGFSPTNVEEFKKKIGIKYKSYLKQQDLSKFLK
jgi:uncharacterized protein YecE (DUF72 family)